MKTSSVRAGRTAWCWGRCRYASIRRATRAVYTCLISGQVMLVADVPPTVLPHIQSKRMRPIATSMSKRIPQLPDVLTVEEQGVPGYNLNTWTSS